MRMKIRRSWCAVVAKPARRSHAKSIRMVRRNAPKPIGSAAARLVRGSACSPLPNVANPGTPAYFSHFRPATLLVVGLLVRAD